MKITAENYFRATTALHNGAIRLMVANPNMSPSIAAERSVAAFVDVEHLFIEALNKVVEIDAAHRGTPRPGGGTP